MKAFFRVTAAFRSGSFRTSGSRVLLIFALVWILVPSLLASLNEVEAGNLIRFFIRSL